MRLTMALAAALLCLGIAAPSAAANSSVSHILMRTVQRPEVAGAPALVFAAALEPQPAEREGWGEVLLRVARGGFNAVYVSVPWNVGKEGSLAVADLDAFLAKVAETGLKAIIGPPIDDPFGLWREWLAPIQPVLEKHAETILWLQARADSPQGGAAELSKAAQALKCALPVAEGVTTQVTSERDPQRPYREPEVSVALRVALAEGATALVWDQPFAGTAPPLISIDDVPPAVVHHGRGGALPIAYYEAHLFSQVARCLGDPLAKAQPAEGAAADAAGISVTQRNLGRQGFLFVRAPAEPVQRFHLSYTDPESGEKMTVPRTQGLSLRSFGAGVRVLPLNLPVPGA
ncbi:MAG TPA: beta-galactosidase, partial [Armatimonadota bacterium]|nr:beta-galactosidase [Armatimonadota bacterium]